MHCGTSCGSHLFIHEDTGPFFKTVLLKSHGLQRGLRANNASSSATNHEITGQSRKRGNSAKSEQPVTYGITWVIVSLRRSIICKCAWRSGCLIWFWFLDGLVFKMLSSLFTLRSCDFKLCINKCVCLFFLSLSLPTRPSVYFHLSVLDAQFLCSVTPLLTKHPSHCYMPYWRRYPIAPSLYQDRAAFTCSKLRAVVSWKPVKKDGLSVTGE